MGQSKSNRNLSANTVAKKKLKKSFFIKAHNSYSQIKPQT